MIAVNGRPDLRNHGKIRDRHKRGEVNIGWHKLFKQLTRGLGEAEKRRRYAFHGAKTAYIYYPFYMR